MKRPRKRHLTFALLVPAILGAAWKVGLLALLRDPAAMHALVERHAVLGALAFVALYTLISALGVPGVVFLLPAAIVFPKHEAFALNLIGSVTSSWLAFALVRSTFRASIEARVPKRLRRWDEAIARNELTTVITARLTFFLLPPVSWALGLTKVRTLPYLIGTTIGMLPGVWFCTYVGGSFFDWLRAQPWWVWATFLGVVALALVVRRVRARQDEDEESDR